MKDTLFFSTKITFGKYKGHTVYSIYNRDKSYVEWLVSIWRGTIDWKLEKALED